MIFKISPSTTALWGNVLKYAAIRWKIRKQKRLLRFIRCMSISQSLAHFGGLFLVFMWRSLQSTSTWTERCSLEYRLGKVAASLWRAAELNCNVGARSITLKLNFNGQMVVGGQMNGWRASREGGGGIWGTNLQKQMKRWMALQCIEETLSPHVPRT